MLAVYADHLESIGEARGELISIDLRIDDAGETPELLAYRKELLLKWFGFEPRGARHGFVDIDATSADPVSQLKLLDGPASPFVRKIAIVGAPVTIAAGIAKLAETQRPWLVELVVRQWSEGAAPSVTDSMCAALAAAAPHLARLEVDGRRVFGHFKPAALAHARISGVDALASLDSSTIASLDFALHAHLATAHEKKLTDKLIAAPFAKLANLVALDLSRNNPGFLDPDTLGGGEDIFAVLAKLPIRGQLERVTLPRIASHDSFAHLQAALAGMPKLRELVLHRGVLGVEERLSFTPTLVD